MNLLEKTEALFHSARVSLIEAAAALYEVQKTEVWKERNLYNTWGEYVETLGISQSGASKLLAVFSHYVIEGRVSQDKLAGIDTEKLYLATSLTGTPEEQFTKAELLSRQEIKAQKMYEQNGHECEHEETITICKSCNRRI